MKVLNMILLFGISILFSGCASMFVPDSAVIKNLPIIEIGSQQKKPENNEYVLHIPAGAEVPVHFSIKGGLVSSKIEHKSTTKINKELYIYKYWASLDGKNWQPSRDLITMPITIGLGPEGGQVHISIDLAK